MMKWFRNLTISTKLIFFVVLLIGASLGGISLISGYQVQQLSEEQTAVIARETAYHYATLMQVQLEKNLNQIRVLARLIETLQQGQTGINREQVNALLKNTLQSEAELVGIYAAFEPNAFDGNDKPFSNVLGNSATGRFLPYWLRNEKNELVMRSLTLEQPLETAEFYSVPKNKRHEFITEPYLYTNPITKQSEFITALSVPLFNQNQVFIGVIGVFVPLQSLQDTVQELTVEGSNTAYVTVYSSAGIVVASKNGENFGKPIREVTFSEVYIQAVLKNKAFMLYRFSKLLQEMILSYGAEIHIGQTQITWVVSINIPMSELFKPLIRLYVVSAIVGITTLLLALLLIYWLANEIATPLHKAVKISQAIAVGRLDNEIEPKSTDETGQLLQAFKIMQTQLHQKIVEDKHIADEALRINEALDNVSTGVLIADNNYRIIYVNNAAQRFFKQNETTLKQFLPSFNANAVVGQLIDIYHKNPTKQRQILANMTQGYAQDIRIGSMTASLNINIVINKSGEKLGWVLEWRDRTTEVMMEEELKTVVSAASTGQFDKRIQLTDKNGFFRNIGETLNQALHYNQQMISELIRVFSAVAQGDLTQQIQRDYAGDLQLLKTDVNATIQQLIQVMYQIQQSADTVSAASQTISAGNQNLSQRTEQQAAALEETAASIEEITGTIQQNAENAQRAKLLATEAQNAAQQGGAVMQTAIKTMQQINQSSKQISDIISVIDEIAFQTNLLALNAAVEAARAGEHGRGFAVVATEVRNLAQRSAIAAKEIKQLIQQSVQQIEEGTTRVNESGKMLERIVISVSHVNNIVAEISAACLEQASGIQQINKAIAQMDEMTQQNAVLVEEATTASAEMQNQATDLKNSIAFFKTL
ncbi:methyl-accepting chemotaxis protein [Beggiatoa alba B18LD]|uniref:Methyl-accepting chemotaxis protein n=1 Tax=Beggiatoa alba B18LD TaxID=395493 RepID=I3CDE2_9GAMM|nr:methyl-accepting chemotaxis protein [Beggiatoa alba]EIJ41635.1 methyl-accepting chemotaxis protein [Beggiatoa alba B18LD]